MGYTLLSPKNWQKQPPEAGNFIKKETLAQVFSCEFCEISNKKFFTEHLWTAASELTEANNDLHKINWGIPQGNIKN